MSLPSGEDAGFRRERNLLARAIRLIGDQGLLLLFAGRLRQLFAEEKVLFGRRRLGDLRLLQFESGGLFVCWLCFGF